MESVIKDEFISLNEQFTVYVNSALNYMLFEVAT